jgi:DNA topoisomerase-1
MPYTLLIVESPAKCKKIEEYLGNGYKCIASFGHITELNGLESIDISNNFSPHFRVDSTKNQQIEKIRKAITNSSEVLIATDDDREGEAIGWHICQQFKLNVNTTKRIIFNEITKTALQRAVQTPLTLNLDLVHAQQARQILDILVGYKISPILWKYIKLDSKQVLSAGRCQTPALKLIYDNQREIDNSPNKIVYNTTGYFTNKNIPFDLDYNYDNEETIGIFLEETVNHQHIFNLSEPKNTTKNPPLPFITSTIQQVASNEFKYSPKETMSICQKLYEGGFITYMRTDSKIYSKEFIEKSKEFIRDEYGEEYIHTNIDLLSETGEVKISKKKKNEDKVKAQEAHEAIRPTDILRKSLPDEMESKEKKIYKLIWTNTVESCMSPAIYKSITATISAAENHNYKYSSEQAVFPGWKIVDGYELSNPTYVFLQTIKNNSRINYNRVISKVTMKETKHHYTEAKLVQLLEEKSIGRPSTFASIIDKIQARGYVKKENVTGKKLSCVDFELVGEEITEINTEREFGNEKGKLVIQPIGVVVCEFLIKYYDDLFKYEYTKYMEDILDNISKGNTVWYDLCRECLAQIENSTYQINLIEKISANQSHSNEANEANEANGDETIKKESKFTSKKLGKYNNETLTLKRGKYGLYVVWGENKKSLSGIDKEVSEITLNDVISFINRPVTNHYQIQGQTTDNPNMVRYINNDMSIRKGKYGDYIFYKTKSMKMPKFLSLLKYKGDYKTDTLNSFNSWVKETYNI